MSFLPTILAHSSIQYLAISHYESDSALTGGNTVGNKAGVASVHLMLPDLVGNRVETHKYCEGRTFIINPVNERASRYIRG